MSALGDYGDRALIFKFAKFRTLTKCWHRNSRNCRKPVVCPAKAGMFSRRQTCRGRSQSPVVWIAEVMETETLKPIDKVSPGEAMSHRAVIKVNALWPRKGVSPRAEPSTGGRRPHEQPKTDRYGCSPRRGGSDSTVTRTCRATGEALLVPTRNRRSKVGRITGENREVGRRREGGGWVRSSNE